MKKIISVIIFLFAINSLVFASQPEGEWEPPSTPVKGKDLTVIWNQEAYRPEVLCWMQGAQIPDPQYLKNEKGKIIIARKGMNTVPTKLLIVPEDRRLKPEVVSVEPNIEKIVFEPEAIPGNEVWFWGFLPKSPCSMWGGPSPLGVSVRLIHKKSVHSSLSGAFVWHVTLEKEDKYEIPFYFIPDLSGALESVSSKDFSKANDISSAMCHAYHGGECKFTLETNPGVWGKSHQLIFKVKSSINFGNCPI